MIELFIFLSLLPKYEIVCDTEKVVVQSEKIGDQDYVPLKSIAELCDINYVFDNKSQRLTLSTSQHLIILIPSISVIMIDSSYQNFPFTSYLIDNEIYFPVHEITPILGGTFEKLIFIKELEEIPEIKNIELFTRGDSTVLKIGCETPLEFDVEFNPQTSVVEIDGRYKDKKLKPAGQVKKVNLSSYNTYTRIELELSDVNSYQQRKDELVFFKKSFKAVHLVVIDPGHGGIDPGAVGKGGLYEKDVNLDISKFLKKLIEDSLGIKVILTRDKDVYLSLKARTQIANRNNADLFLSVHCNAAKRNREARGFETYFLSEARTNEARAVAAMENASLKFDEEVLPSDAINFILYDLAQSAFLEESNYLAECIQTSGEKLLSIPARGVSQAGFYVLRGAFMPAVLVECAFISNPWEEKWLREKRNREKLAYAIFSGVKEYLQGYEQRLSN
uniref:MurNAc-LAA domain-containing protein n=1 Tax=candidate division WOR-3 bacterium TaxID=2052148 RepID=A0A7C4X955_UNCW3